MKPLSLTNINAKSPYEVNASRDGFEFITAAGVRYRIKFIEDNPIGGCETMQFAISKVDDIRSPHDAGVRQTTLVIIDEFFNQNEDVLLYICDTSDSREAFRNRLFLKWFEDFADPGRFTIRTAHAEIEGEGFYAAIIVENTNPLLDEITTDFDTTANALSEKPEQEA